jgi:DNA polymerase-3 subunit epsilon
MIMKQIFIDTETTGVNPRLNGIWQIAGQIRTLRAMPGLEEAQWTVPRKFNYLMRPFPDDIIEDSALAIAGKTREEILSYPEPWQVHHQFTSMLAEEVNKFDRRDKFFFLAYNARFDDDFLREWFVKIGDKYYGSWFWVPVIDIMALAADVLQRFRADMPDFKQATVAAALGMQIPAGVHAADVDAELAMQIYDQLPLFRGKQK